MSTLQTLAPYGPQSGQEIHGQANVTANCNRSANCVREFITLTKNRPPGTYIDGPLDPLHMNVERQELVFVRKASQRSGPNRTAWNADAFSSFNGQPIDPEISSQEEFEACFKFLGVASSTQEFTGDIPNKSGFAAIMAGSITINNTSNQTIYPGDLVRWNAPSIVPGKRDEQYKSVTFALRGHFSTQKKYVATLSRVSFEDLVDKWHSTAGTLWQGIEKLKIPIVRASIARGRTPSMPESHASALWLKQFISLVSYSALVSAAQVGLIQPAVTNENILAYRNNRAAAYKNWPSVSVTGENRESPEQHKAAINQFATLVANVVGLTIDPTKTVTEDAGLLRRIISRSAFSQLSEMDKIDQFVEWINDEFTDSPKLLNDAFFKPNPATPNVPLQLQRIKGDAIALLYRSVAKDIYSFTNNIVGVASNTALPNGPIHLVLS